jgi:hypothetical protein
MAEINLNPYTAESEAIAKKLRMAELLQQQAMQPIEMPSQAGVRVSPLSGLAKMLQAYGASKQSEKATEEQKALEANTMADFAKLYGVMGQTETVPGKVTTPAVPSAPIPENVARQAELARLNQPEAGFEAQAAIGRNLMQPQDMQQIQNLPTSTAAVPEVREPDRQVSMLRAEALSDPKFMKTNAGRMMLAQALMQQRTQEQAAAQRALEVKSRNPEEDLYRVVNGKYEVVSAGKPKATAKWEKSSIFENGQEVTGWVNTNAPDIPGSFVKGATKPEMTEPQRLDAELKLFQANVEAGKAQDVGRKPTVFERLPKGVPVGSKRVGKSPDGKDVFELNGKKYVGE